MRIFTKRSILSFFLIGISFLASAQVSLQEAQKLYEQDKFKEALNLYDKYYADNTKTKIRLTTTNSQMWRCLHWRGMCYYKLNKKQKALNDFNAAAKERKKEITYAWLGLINAEFKRYKEAIQYFTTSINLNSAYKNIFDTYSRRGECYSNLENSKEAVKDFTNSINSNKQKTNIDYTYANRGTEYFFLKQYDKALSDYSKAIKYRKDASNYVGRGIVYHKLKKYKLSSNDFKQALSLEKRWDIYVWNGLIYIELRKYDQAIKAYSESIRLNPEKASAKKAFNNRGLCFFNKKQYKLALKDFSESIRRNPNFSSYNNRARVQLKLGRIQEAIKDYTEAIRLHPNYGEAYANRATCYCLQNKFALAKADEKKAIQYGISIKSTCKPNSIQKKKPVSTTRPAGNQTSIKSLMATSKQKGLKTARQLEQQAKGKNTVMANQIIGKGVNKLMNEDVYAGFQTMMKIKLGNAKITGILKYLDKRNDAALKKLSKQVTNNYTRKKAGKSQLPYPAGVPLPGSSWVD